MRASSSPASGKKTSLKTYLITGVLVWLPIMAAIWTISYIVTKSDALINLLPPNWRPEHWFNRHIPGLGILLALIILLVTGVFATNVLGRALIRLWDRVFNHIPIVKTVYSGVKKVSESLLSDSRRSFRTAVLVPFPHHNAWSVGFISGEIPAAILQGLAAADNDDYVPVYVLTTPNPTGGYYLMVKASDVRYLDMSVDDALKYVISLGMVMPTNGVKVATPPLPESLDQQEKN